MIFAIPTLRNGISDVKPQIRKLGTVDCDLVETNPIVFKGEVYRLESISPTYWGNQTKQPYLRFVHPESGWRSEPFARGHYMGTAFVEGDTVYVTAVPQPGGERIVVFVSRDIQRWENWEVLNLPGWGIYNTSVCRVEDKYVLMFEINKPQDQCGVWFTARFATSGDMRRWELTPPECVYAKDRYTAPHCLRYCNGYYYNLFLECFSSPGGGKYPYRYEQHVVRSKDLVNWQLSPHKAVLAASDEDRVVANPSLGPELQKRIAETVNINNSDIDFCEHDGRLIINYSWGDQQVNMHLAEAIYEGTVSEFLQAWFPG